LEQLHPVSFGWALSCCSRNQMEAEDILQMAYLKILTGRARFDGRAAFKTWLFAVIRNTAATERRRGWLRQFWQTSYRQEHANDHQPAGQGAALDTTERQTALRQVLARLPRRQQEVLHLVFYQELTIEDAASVMGVSVGAARTHYERGKHRFRALLQPAEDWQ